MLDARDIKVTVALPMRWFMKPSHEPFPHGSKQLTHKLYPYDRRMIYYDGRELNEQSVVLTLGQVVEQIKSNETVRKRCEALRMDIPEDHQKHIKTNGLHRLFWGTYDLNSHDGKFCDDGLVEHPGVMCFDVDKLDPARAYFVKQILAEDPHVVLAWISPRGSGVKFLVRVPANKEQHRHRYLGVMKYYSGVLGVKLDPTSVNPARACFMSHDPKPYVNWEADLCMEIDMESLTRELTPVIRVVNDCSGDEAWRAVDNFMKNKSPHDAYGRHGYLMDFAAVCNKVGIGRDECESEMKRRFEGSAYGREITGKEIESVVDNRYTKLSHEHSTVKIGKK